MSNFQRIAEKGPAQYKELGLDYFLQEGLVKSRRIAASQAIVDEADKVRADGMHYKDAQRMSEELALLDSNKQKAASMMVQDDVPVDKLVQGLLELKKQTTEINGKIAFAVDEHKKAQAKIDYLHQLGAQPGANQAYYNRWAEKSYNDWEGSLGENGTIFNYSFVPTQIDLDTKYQNSLKLAMENMVLDGDAKRKIDDYNFKIQEFKANNDMEGARAVAEKLYNYVDNMPAVQAVRDSYIRAMDDKDSPIGAYIDFMGEGYKDSYVEQFTREAASAIRQKALPVELLTFDLSKPTKSGSTSGSDKIIDVVEVDNSLARTSGGKLTTSTPSVMSVIDKDDNTNTRYYSAATPTLTPEQEKSLEDYGGADIFLMDKTKDIEEGTEEGERVKKIIDKTVTQSEGQALKRAGITGDGPKKYDFLYKSRLNKVKEQFKDSGEFEPVFNSNQYDADVTNSVTEILPNYSEVGGQPAQKLVSVNTMSRFFAGNPIGVDGKPQGALDGQDNRFVKYLMDEDAKIHENSALNGITSALDVLETSFGYAPDAPTDLSISYETEMLKRKNLSEEDRDKYQLLIDQKVKAYNLIAKAHNKFRNDENTTAELMVTDIPWDAEYIDTNGVKQTVDQYKKRYRNKVADDVHGNKSKVILLKKEGKKLVMVSSTDMATPMSEELGAGVAGAGLRSSAGDVIRKSGLRPFMLASGQDISEVTSGITADSGNFENYNEIFENALVYNIPSNTTEVDTDTGKEFELFNGNLKNASGEFIMVVQNHRRPDKVADTTVKVLNNKNEVESASTRNVIKGLEKGQRTTFKVVRDMTKDEKATLDPNDVTSSVTVHKLTSKKYKVTSKRPGEAPRTEIADNPAIIYNIVYGLKKSKN